MTEASEPPPPPSDREAPPPAEEKPNAKDSGQPKSTAAKAGPTVEASHDESSLVEWITRRDALARARAAYVEAPVTDRELHHRARFALEIGDRAMDPVDPYRLGAGSRFAVGAYRESIYWSLRLHERAEKGASADEPSEGDEPGPTVAELFANASPTVKALVPTHADERVAAALARTFVEDAEQPEAVLVAEAQLLHETALALSQRAEAPQAQIERHLRERTRRSLFALVLALIATFSIVSGARAALRKPNIARNTAWSTSSTAASCNPSKHSCAGSKTDIFFHTLDDASPWFMYDFGAPTSFSSMTIRNRTDCCTDRVVPLIVEISDDLAQPWKEIARQGNDFETWSPSFGKRTARYVRVRVGRKSLLHLEQVAVHP